MSDTDIEDPTVAADAPSETRSATASRLVRRPAAAVLAAALAAALTFAVLWLTDDSGAELDALRTRLDTEAQAEQAATTYALNVSKVDYNAVETWHTALNTGVTEQLETKLDAAVGVVGPLLTQLQYTSTAKPLAARVSQHNGDTYVVQVFVDMTSRSRQTPDGVTATATYTITLDRAAHWTITDVGGVGAPLAATPAAPATPGR
ncbi:hypothetical protein ACWDSJ_16565 [Nocardia sp. NPDC003482]